MLCGHGVQVAPRTFYAWAVRAPSKRSLWDATITEVLAGCYEPDAHGRKKPESLYGSLKMWAHLQREAIPVAKSTVERLMLRNGWQGVRRQKTVRTTIADATASRATGSGGPPVRGSGAESAARRRLHLRQTRYGGVCLRRVRHRRLRGGDRGVGGLGVQAHPVRRIGDPPSRSPFCSQAFRDSSSAVGALSYFGTVSNGRTDRVRRMCPGKTMIPLAAVAEAYAA